MLERAMAATRRPHPGLLHLYVHTMEMSPHPERALPAADQLRDLVPDAGHLRHMPTHIDVLCGRYGDVVACNEAAIEADRKFLEREGPLNFYTLYRCHNYHFKIYGAMFQGRLEPALEAADELAATLSGDVLRIEVPPMADWAEAFVPTRLHVLVRFGLWQQLIDEPLPDDAALYATTTTLLHYAKGVAHAATGDVESAKRERERLRTRATSGCPRADTCSTTRAGTSWASPSRCWTGRSSTAAGNLDPRSSTCDAPSSVTTTCSTTSRGAGCSQPATRSARCCSSRARSRRLRPIYRADLGLDNTLRRPCQHPGNVWSLHGYHECLHRLGRCDEADALRPQLDAALAEASVPITASCFCRVG